MCIDWRYFNDIKYKNEKNESNENRAEFYVSELVLYSKIIF